MLYILTLWYLQMTDEGVSNVNKEAVFILRNCTLVNMHIGACLAISIFSSTPLGGSLSLQGRQPLLSVICPRGCYTCWINMSLILFRYTCKGSKFVFTRTANPLTIKTCLENSPSYIHCLIANRPFQFLLYVCQITSTDIFIIRNQ